MIFITAITKERSQSHSPESFLPFVQQKRPVSYSLLCSTYSIICRPDHIVQLPVSLFGHGHGHGLLMVLGGVSLNCYDKQHITHGKILYVSYQHERK